MSTQPATKTVKRTTKKAAAKPAEQSAEKAMAAVVKTATPAPVEQPAPEQASQKKERKPTIRREVTSETVQASFNEIIESVKAQIEQLGKDNKQTTKGRSRGVGVKFLQSTNKKLRTLQGDVSRVCKPKRQRKANSNSNKSSGIMLEVNWTDEFCAFVGKPAGTKMSRVSATKIVCDYIAGARFNDAGERIQGFAPKVDANGAPVTGKDGKPVLDTTKPLLNKRGDCVAVASLQNPECKKEVNADVPLKKLFKQDVFTYTQLQKLLSTHIVKNE